MRELSAICEPILWVQIQAQLRAEIDPASFLTSFNSPGQQVTTNTNFGSVRFFLGQNSPALATLPNGGLAQGVIRLAACGLWSPHHHARLVPVSRLNCSATGLLDSENRKTCGKPSQAKPSHSQVCNTVCLVVLVVVLEPTLEAYRGFEAENKPLVKIVETSLMSFT